MSEMLQTYEESFTAAQTEFDGQIDAQDRSRLIVVSSQEAAYEYLTEHEPNREKFFPIEVNTATLEDTAGLFVNRALLMHNPRLDALSPVIITPDHAHRGEFQITMFHLPYDPQVGFSAGMHWGISAKAQTQVEGFGGHGNQPTGFEQGHFGAVVLGGGNAGVAKNIEQNGDKASHDILHAGLIERYRAEGMVAVPAMTTRILSANKPVNLRLYWHEGLQGEDNGPIRGDYPDATRLLLGGAVHAIGQRGLERARQLVDDAVRGADA